ncbi:hypothetical protein ABEV74_10895 [Paenibacillus cisolokensis]|uniref:hypothetical protein n=1 Tax=Paenibacillus cisolokensis TaxID=1658519 RepID=UPI003D2E986E
MNNQQYKTQSLMEGYFNLTSPQNGPYFYPVKILNPQLAEDMEKIARRIRELSQLDKPTDELAILCGIQDKSYHTVRYGFVRKFSGLVYIQMANGDVWKAEGHSTKGTPEVLYREGYISFEKIDIPQYQREFREFIDTINWEVEDYKEASRIREAIKKYWIVIPYRFWKLFSEKGSQYLLSELGYTEFYDWDVIAERIKDGILPTYAKTKYREYLNKRTTKINMFSGCVRDLQ